MSGTATGTRGRGALSNRSGRFEVQTRHAFDDGWCGGLGGDLAVGRDGGLGGDPDGDGSDGEPRADATRLHTDTSRTVISRNQSPDVPFDRSINPYRGCEHGCVYCYARPTHAFLGHSPGLDFETQIYRKPAAARLLARELAAPKYRPQPIAMGTNTDPYQPIERQLRITRSIVELLAACRHPLTITTKSFGVVRDIDLLAPMAANRLAGVAVSVTTLDAKLARAMEPRAATPSRRIEAIRQLAQEGIPVAVMVAPVIPGLTDHEMETILGRAAEAGASAAGYIVLRLPLEVADLFREWLEGVRPGHAARVLHRLSDMRGGRLNRSTFGERMVGTGPEAELLRARFKTACRKLGLAPGLPEPSTELFVPPQPDPSPPSDRQLRLF